VAVGRRQSNLWELSARLTCPKLLKNAAKKIKYGLSLRLF